MSISHNYSQIVYAILTDFHARNYPDVPNLAVRLPLLNSFYFMCATPILVTTVIGTS